MLAMAEGSSATLGRVVGRFPRWVTQEGTQSREVVGIQLLLLPAQWRQCGRFGISLPGVVALLSFITKPPPPEVVSPDREPRFEEGTGDAKRTANGAGQQGCERLPFFRGQVLSLVEKERAVEP